MCEEWYRTWAIQGANGTWGMGMDEEDQKQKESDLHPMSLKAASDCHMSPHELSRLEIGRDGGLIPIDLEYASPHTGQFDYNWGKPESEECCQDRMSEVVGRLYSPDFSVLLLSHGGPTSGAYRKLTGNETRIPTGYTGLFCYQPGGDKGGWEALLAGDHAHLEALKEGGSSMSENDAKEQGVSLDPSVFPPS